MNKQIKQVIQIAISFMLVLILMIGAYFIVMKKPSNNKITIEDNLNADLSIVSSDPMKTTMKFIEANGTIGNIDTDITQDSMKTDEAIFKNGTRRLNSLNKIEKAVIPGNLLILGNEKDNIKNFVRNLDYPFLYKIDNVEVSKPSEPVNLIVYSEAGATTYESVKLLVDFESTRIHYTSPKDITYAGVHRQFSNVEKYEDIEVILVKSGDLWFIYDIVDAEYKVNERFASWSGAGPSTINYDKNIETDTFVLEGFVMPDLPDELKDSVSFSQPETNKENLDLEYEDMDIYNEEVPIGTDVLKDNKEVNNE